MLVGCLVVGLFGCVVVVVVAAVFRSCVEIDVLYIAHRDAVIAGFFPHGVRSNNDVVLRGVSRPQHPCADDALCFPMCSEQL